ncbi:hypothetical protein JYT23_00505 [Mariprofundus ferrooxydans]|nr:hypothetical protein [Mariprofundus ferrooxydans]
MRMKSIFSRLTALLFVALLLASCGGGGTAAAPTPAPVTTLSWDQSNWNAVNWQ